MFLPFGHFIEESPFWIFGNQWIWKSNKAWLLDWRFASSFVTHNHFLSLPAAAHGRWQ
jgi:hypothetical protein